jgi:hypothetical protein
MWPKFNIFFFVARLSGVKNVEVLICYMITQICVLVIQIALTLVVMLVAFEVPNRGSVYIISLLCFVQGICGMSFGGYQTTNFMHKFCGPAIIVA